jgi:LPXTG-motif cell wall-anchored protein
MNKKQIIGIAAGVVVLTAVGVLLSRRKKNLKDRVSDGTEDLKDTYRHKLSSLQRKAKKEFADVLSHGESVTDKVNDLVKKVSTGLA